MEIREALKFGQDFASNPLVSLAKLKLGEDDIEGIVVIKPTVCRTTGTVDYAWAFHPWTGGWDEVDRATDKPIAVHTYESHPLIRFSWFQDFDEMTADIKKKVTLS